MEAMNDQIIKYGRGGLRKVFEFPPEFPPSRWELNDVREIDKNKKDRFRVYSMQYNADIPIVLDNNHFNVSYSGKKDKLNIKEQNYELKGEVKIRIQYDIKKNKSTIILKEPKGEKIKAVIDGLIILELNTDRGQLRTYFTQSSP